MLSLQKGQRRVNNRYIFSQFFSAAAPGLTGELLVQDVCASASACLRAIAKVSSGSLCLPFSVKPKQIISSLRIEHQGSSQFV